MRYLETSVIDGSNTCVGARGRGATVVRNNFIGESNPEVASARIFGTLYFDIFVILELAIRPPSIEKGLKRKVCSRKLRALKIQATNGQGTIHKVLYTSLSVFPPQIRPDSPPIATRRLITTRTTKRQKPVRPQRLPIRIILLRSYHRIKRKDRRQVVERIPLVAEPAPLKQQAQIPRRKKQKLVHHPVEREAPAILFQRPTARHVEFDAVLPGQHDERVDAEHGRAAVDLFFVLGQPSKDPILPAVDCGMDA